jgi:Domain of unknown function (DUF4331)
MVRKLPVLLTALLAALVAAALAVTLTQGSSHREAPLSSIDPTADDTDVYAFKAADAPNALTIVANWIPFEDPAGGPNFYRSLFEADHGSPAQAVALARRGWSAAPSVRSADALGWALTRAGRPAAGVRWARRALRLGSRDAMFLYHEGMAARAAGQRDLARRWLAGALAGNPRFSPLHAPQALRALREAAR